MIQTTLNKAQELERLESKFRVQREMWLAVKDHNGSFDKQNAATAIMERIDSILDLANMVMAFEEQKELTP
jgi:hypothetical protein